MRHKVLFLLDVKCNGVETMLQNANQLNLFLSSWKWFILLNNNESVPNIFQKFTLDFESQIFFKQKINETSFALKHIYSINNTIVHKDTSISNWTSGGEFLLRSNNLNKTKIRIASVMLNKDTLNHLIDYRYKNIDMATKLGYHIINAAIDFINGTSEFIFVNDWGYKDLNGTYTGMIGMVVKKTADLTGTVSVMTQDRIAVMDYIAMTTPTTLKFIFRQPPLSYVSNVFTLPFTNLVWISVLLLIIIISILLYAVLRQEWRYNTSTITNENYYITDPLSEVIIMTLGAICQQGAPYEPRSISGRIAMFFTLISLMFIYVFYSAYIVAILQSTDTNIDTLEDLLKSKLELGADNISYNHYYFKHASDPIRKAIYKEKIAPAEKKSNFLNYTHGVEKIRQGFFAFHIEPGIAYKLISETYLENEKCGLKEISFLPIINPWIAVQKNSGYKDLFKIAFIRVREVGIQAREFAKLYTRKPTCNSGRNSFISVGLTEIYFANVLLITGICMAIFILLLEFICNKYFIYAKR